MDIWVNGLTRANGNAAGGFDRQRSMGDGFDRDIDEHMKV